MIRYVPGTIPGREGIQQIAILDGDTHIGKWVEESGRLDHDQNALPKILELIDPGMMVYDVGAFIGDHTAAYASKLKGDGCVVAFEAMPDAYKCLVLNTAGVPNVVTLCLPVGDGGAVGGGWQGVVGIGTGNYGARFLSDGDGSCKSTRLDELEDIPCSLIKLDIEGWEVRALRGARETIARNRPIIVCEVNPGALARAGSSMFELHRTLTSFGYEMRDLFTAELWRPDDPRAQFDVVARPICR